MVSEHHAYGGEGAVELAKAVKAACALPTDFKFLYPVDEPIKAKIEVCQPNIRTLVARASGALHADLIKCHLGTSQALLEL